MNIIRYVQFYPSVKIREKPRYCESSYLECTYTVVVWFVSVYFALKGYINCIATVSYNAAGVRRVSFSQTDLYFTFIFFSRVSNKYG